MLTDKQRRMVEAAEAIAKDASKLAKVLEQKKLEHRRRKQVFHAIEKLSNPVTNEELRKQLPLIDFNSWLEVVEERYIDKLCGFPTCSKEIDKNVKTPKYRIDRKNKKVYEIDKNVKTPKYRIDRKNKKVYVSCTERQKYCSEKCFELSIGLRAQLSEHPFWLTGVRNERSFDLTVQKKEKPVEAVSDIFVDEAPIVTRLGHLTVAESAETDEEEDRETNHTGEKDLTESLSSFLTLASDSSISHNTTSAEQVKTPRKSPRKSTGQTNPDEALERLRKKFGRDGKKGVLRPPIMVDAKPVDMEHDKKVSESCYGGFEKFLKEWISPATVEFLRTRGGQATEEEDLDIDDGTLTEVKSIVQQFFAGDISLEKRRKKAIEEQEAQKIRMPVVDNIDQHSRRVELLMNMMKASWKKLMDHMGAQHPFQTAKPLIATFGLTASNMDLDKFEKRIGIALLFKMVCYCDEELNDCHFSEEGEDPKFLSYLEAIECDKSVYDRLQRVIFDNL
uniref:RNA polymerase II subunit B1 CTD phosphatase RPAP2 homolog n=1 Tax=Steinernema glaseri TaxID=37863 RepID=A0A1I7ZJM9_9BILA